ncbi:MAG: lysostaphin resistance A-like protein [Planctomycetota bacterium]
MSFEAPAQLTPALLLLALGILGLAGSSLVLGVAGLAYAPLRDRLWPRGPSPRPFSPGAAARALVLLMVGVIGIRIWLFQFRTIAGEWTLPLGGLLAQGLMLVCVLAAAFTPPRGPEEVVERLGLSRPRARHLLSGAAGWLGSLWAIWAVSAVSAVLYMLVSGEALPIQGTVQFIQSVGPGPKLATAALAVVVAPVVEEAMFRGLIFRSFRTRMGFWAAGSASAALFALVHLDPLHSLRLGALGLVLAWVCERTGSLWPAIFLHALQNLVAVALIYSGMLHTP